MPNIDFYIRNNHTVGDAVIGIHAVKDDLLREIETMVVEASRRGAQRAREVAPRGPERRARLGRRISEAIIEHPVRYRPGGAGGGGFFEAGFEASGAIAPHLHDVMEGTGEPKGEGHITAARGNLLALDKGGEGVHVRAWVRGQHPQATWWEIAEAASERFIQREIQDLRIGPGFTR